MQIIYVWFNVLLFLRIRLGDLQTFYCGYSLMKVGS